MILRVILQAAAVALLIAAKTTLSWQKRNAAAHITLHITILFEIEI